MRNINCDTVLSLIQAEINYQYHEKYYLQKEDYYMKQWKYHLAKAELVDSGDCGLLDDPFLKGLYRMLLYLDIDHQLVDLYLVLSRAACDAQEPFRPIWGTASFAVANADSSPEPPTQMRFVAVREAVLSQEYYRQFTDTGEPFGFKAILLGSCILLPCSNLIGCVWVHPEGSKQGHLVSEVKGHRYIVSFTAT